MIKTLSELNHFQIISKYELKIAAERLLIEANGNHERYEEKDVRTQ